MPQHRNPSNLPKSNSKSKQQQTNAPTTNHNHQFQNATHKPHPRIPPLHRRPHQRHSTRSSTGSNIPRIRPTTPRPTSLNTRAPALEFKSNNGSRARPRRIRRKTHRNRHHPLRKPRNHHPHHILPPSLPPRGLHNNHLPQHPPHAPLTPLILREKRMVNLEFATRRYPKKSRTRTRDEETGNR